MIECLSNVVLVVESGMEKQDVCFLYWLLFLARLKDLEIEYHQYVDSDEVQKKKKEREREKFFVVSKRAMEKEKERASVKAMFCE